MYSTRKVIISRYDVLSKELDLLKLQGRNEVFNKDQQRFIVKNSKWIIWREASTSLLTIVYILLGSIVLILFLCHFILAD